MVANGLLSVVIGAALAAAKVASPAPGVGMARGVVSYALADRVYLSLGNQDGLMPDCEVELLTGGHVVGRAVVIAVTERGSVARLLGETLVVRPGVEVRARVASPAPAEVSPAPNPLIRVEPGAWQKVAKAGLERIHFAGGAGGMTAVRATRLSASLVSTGWTYLETQRDRTLERERLDVMVSGPIDRAGRFWVDADLSAAGQPLAPTGRGFHEKRSAWLAVYRSSVWYRGIDGLGMGLGRQPGFGLRYGLVDGGFASWRFGDEGPTLHLAAGLRPETETLGVAFDRPTARLALDGSSVAGWGLIWYQAALGWLGHRTTSTNALEASASLGSDVGRRVWLGAEAGAVAPDLANVASAPVVLDRVAVTSSVRIGRSAAVRVSARRLEEPGLESERALLPVGYLPRETTYDVLVGMDTTLGSLGPWFFDASLAGGGVRGSTPGYSTAWGSPSLVWRWPTLARMRARIAYRLEYGWVSGHQGELGIGFEPTAATAVDVRQQGGVVLVHDRHELLLSQSTWLTASYRAFERLELALRGRGIYGQAGSGAEVSLLLAGRDWL